jgi:hypothetical protein
MTPANPSGVVSRARFNLSEWALQHRPFVLFVVLVCALVGVLSYERLGQSRIRRSRSRSWS